MSAIGMIGYGAAALLAALCLFYRQKAKRAEDRRISETTRLKGEANAYQSALNRASTRIRKLSGGSYDTGLRFDENGALLGD